MPDQTSLSGTKGPQHPDLIVAAHAIEAAKTEYRAVLRRIRESCPHERIAQQDDGSYGADLSHHHARRICCDCGYEETSYWSDRMSPWRGRNTADGHTTAKDGAPLVLTGDFVKRVPFTGHVTDYRPLTEDPPAPPTTPGGRTDG